MDDNKLPVQNDTPSENPVNTELSTYQEPESSYATPEQRIDDTSEPAAPVHTFKDTPVAAPAPVYADASAVAPVVPPKKKSSVKKWLLGGVAVLLLGALGSLAYWQYAEASKFRVEAEFLRNALLASQEANRQAEAENKVTAKDEEPKITDKSILTKNAEAYIKTVTGSTDVVRDVAIEGTFAVVTIGDKTSTIDNTSMVFEKVGEDWVEISTHLKGSLTETDRTKLNKQFGVPVSFLQKT